MRFHQMPDWVGLRNIASNNLRLHRLSVHYWLRKSIPFPRVPRARAVYLWGHDRERERHTHSPSLDPRFRGGDGGWAENDRREGKAMPTLS